MRLVLETSKKDGIDCGSCTEVRRQNGAWRLAKAHLLGMLMAFAVLASNIALSQSQSADKNVKEAEPELGTRIPRTIASSQTFSPNKKWSELSDEEHAAFRAQYEDMPDTDEPPYPLGGMAPIFRQLSIDAGRAGVYGTFIIDVTVNARGDGTKVTLVKYPSVEAAKVVAYVLVKTKYKPAVCHGKPCIMDFPFSIKLVVG
jgi:hypothetical protein